MSSDTHHHYAESSAPFGALSAASVPTKGEPVALGQVMRSQMTEDYHTMTTNMEESTPAMAGGDSEAYPGVATQSGSSYPIQSNMTYQSSFLITGDIDTTPVSARPEETTHIFCCDYAAPIGLNSDRSFRDRKRDLHDRIFQSYIHYSVRRHAEEEKKYHNQLWEQVAAGRAQSEANASPESAEKGGWRSEFRAGRLDLSVEGLLGAIDGSDLGDRDDGSIPLNIGGLAMVERGIALEGHKEDGGDGADVRLRGSLNPQAKDFDITTTGTTAGQHTRISGQNSFGSTSNVQSKQEVKDFKIPEEDGVSIPIYVPGILTDNPLNNSTQYVMHLTSRKDFSHVFSHRYFICPNALDTDWTEISLMEWFAEGKPFDFRAKEWDLKCPFHHKFYRMTLCPNLNLRIIQVPSIPLRTDLSGGSYPFSGYKLGGNYSVRQNEGEGSYSFDRYLSRQDFGYDSIV